MNATHHGPLVLIAELTHRCPLRCAYCSNPLRLAERAEELGGDEWARVFAEASALGVMQVHLTGGEPLLRGDVVQIARAAAHAGTYPTLITSGLGCARRVLARTLVELALAGVGGVQLSFQDTEDAGARAVAGHGAIAHKVAFARLVREVGMSLTVNVVLHRANLHRLESFIELALDLDADRLELAHVQYHGWALLNQAALLPSAEQVERAAHEVAMAKLRHAGRMDISLVMADQHSGRARPCMGGWGRRALVVNPSGQVLPCHAAASLPLSHDSVRERALAEIWHQGAAFRAFRGEAWMEEPCRSCPERHVDFGGCRCQALAVTGRATAADPACRASRDHVRVLALRRGAARDDRKPPYRLRGYGGATGAE